MRSRELRGDFATTLLVIVALALLLYLTSELWLPHFPH